jgi:hypothetical protein
MDSDWTNSSLRVWTVSGGCQSSQGNSGDGQHNIKLSFRAATHGCTTLQCGNEDKLREDEQAVEMTRWTITCQLGTAATEPGVLAYVFLSLMSQEHASYAPRLLGVYTAVLGVSPKQANVRSQSH